jgi:hypothetical protein
MSTITETPVTVEAVNDDVPKNPARRVATLGSIRHRHEHTNEIILVPTPSSDPNDPLNWYVDCR